MHAACRLKKGDTVFLTKGKDRGKQGKIEAVYRKTHRVLLPGLNMYKRHMKKQEGKHEGGVIDLSRPVPMGNVALVCSSCGKPTRVRYVISGKKKDRACKRCGSVV